jgi:probable ribonuclease FAU-1
MGDLSTLTEWDTTSIMVALRIRGLYAVALTQLFRQDTAWDLVQPSEEVRTRIDYPWRMGSPDVDIDDEPDDKGQRDTLRLSGPADAVGQVLSSLWQQCFDVIARPEPSEVGALYMGLIGLISRERRQAVVYLGEERAGILPLRLEDHDLRVGMALPVRLEATAGETAERPQLSRVLTIPGQYAVITAVQTVRLSKQITDVQQRERLQRLGEAQDMGSWGIIWRTAAQHTADEVLIEELRRLTLEAQKLRERLRDVTTIGRVRGGEVVFHVLLPGHAKAVCDTWRAQLLPTLPGHHKYKARGDVYGATVDALEKELPTDVLRSRTANLSVLASVDAMQPPVQPHLRLLLRDPEGQRLDQGEVQRVAYDIYEGWVEIRQPLRHKDSYPKGLRMHKGRGDYAVTRFHEGSWSYLTRFYARDHAWQGDYAGITTPVAIFSDSIQLVDLRVAVLRSREHDPQLVGLDALQRLQRQGVVSADLVQKVQAEGEALLAQLAQEELPQSPAPAES